MSTDALTTYVLLSLGIFGILFSVSLLIASTLSEDKETSIVGQLWRTFFGSSDERH